MAGPALAAAACPVRTKMPVPMMAPTPSMINCAGPRTRLRTASPSPVCSRVMASIDLVAKMDMSATLSHRWREVLKGLSNGWKNVLSSS
jgi:hypothetical protein